LKRKGDEHQVRGAYFFEIGEKHLLSPQLIFNYNDLDGDAMKNYVTDFQLTYAYFGPKFGLSLNGFIGYADYDKKTRFTAKPRMIRATAWVRSGPGRIPSAGSLSASINFGCTAKPAILCRTRTLIFMKPKFLWPLRAFGLGFKLAGCYVLQKVCPVWHFGLSK
jgi:hypothetical protein